MTIRAAAYIRVSDAKQDQDGTPDTQRMRILDYAAKRSAELGEPIEVADWYTDVYSGGDSYLDPSRREFQALRQAVSQGRYDLVLAYKDDRIARGSETLIFVHECSYADTRVETALDGVLKADDLLSTLTLVMRGEGSREERKKIMQRAADGMAKRAKREGRRIPGCRPKYGYRWDDPTPHAKGGLVIDPDSGAIVRRIFREFAAGASLRTIALGLTADGIPTPTQYAGRANPSKNWSWGSVRYILNDEEYTGRSVALKTRNEWVRNDEGRKRPIPKRRDESETVELPEGTVPALVDAETFAIAQDRLVHNQQMSVRNNPDPEATLLRGGFAVCGYCGHNLVTSNAPRNGSRQYTCSANTRRRHGCPNFGINARVLDPFVWGKVSAALRDPETIIADLRQQLENEDDPTERDMQRLDRQITEIDHKLAKLAQAIAMLSGDGAAAGIEAITSQMTTLGRHKERLTAERAETERRRQSRTDGWAAAEQFVETVKAMQHDVDSWTYDQKREALLRFGVRVKVRRVGDEPRIEVSARIDLDKFATPWGERWAQRIVRVTTDTTADELGEDRYRGDVVCETARPSAH